MTRSFYNKTVIRKRAPLVDDGQGGEERDWSAAVSEDIGGWGVSAGGTDEDESRREGSRVDYVIRGPFDADVHPSDRIVLFGEEFEIDGGVLRQPSPTGLAAHSIVRLRRWEG